jgi:hypothetical protein
VSRARSVGRWLWEFVVGDDWVIAAGVVIALAVTGVVAGAGSAAWWVMPLAVVVLLVVSVRRGAPRRGRQ